MHFPMWLRPYMAWPIRSIPIRLRAGPNAGARWSLAASPRRYRSGRYELQRFVTIGRLLQAGDVFWDVGAHFGYASLIAGRVVGPLGRIVCVEPSAYNRGFLRRHLRWNGIKATVLPYAVGDQDGMVVQFGGSHTSVTFRVGGGSDAVTMRTLPSLIRECGLAPTLIKLDVEGSEAQILQAAQQQLTPEMAILVSVHSYENYLQCGDMLRACGFTVLESRDIEQFREVRNRNWPQDPELLAFGSERRWQRSDFENGFVIGD